jgi:hypothetical protein
MSRRLRILTLLLPATLLLAGCSEEEPRVVDVGARVSTAEDALECAHDTKVESHSVAAESAAAHPDAETAVRAWAERVRRRADIPADGYRVAVEEVGTVLFTHETDHRAEIAVIAKRTEGKGGELGWLVTSWARCRPGQTS